MQTDKEIENDRLENLIEMVADLKEKMRLDTLGDLAIVCMILDIVKQFELALKDIKNFEIAFAGAIIAELNELFPNITLLNRLKKTNKALFTRKTAS